MFCSKQIGSYIPKRFTTSVATGILQLSAKDMVKHNRTSAKLYRIILKSIRAINSDDKHRDGILLQPAVNHRDYGTARVLKSIRSIYWSMNKDKKENEKQLLSFFSWWTQYQNDTFYNDLIDDKISEMLDSKDDDIVESLLNKFLYITSKDLKDAAKSSFQLFRCTPDLTKKDILSLQRFAIESIKLFQNQKAMWNRTSIEEDFTKGLRVIATSSCIGVTALGLLSNEDRIKNRFAYRIRIENFNDATNHQQHSYQLLGRKWIIKEDKYEPLGLDACSMNETAQVDAPTTGVVGHLPVLNPGDVFEYVSGCELSTTTGSMKGAFYMSHVPDGTPSAQCGDIVGAFQFPAEQKFQVSVAPFRLKVDEPITRDIP